MEMKQETQMTDHFKDCKPGDTVRVEIRDRFYPFSDRPEKAWVGTVPFNRDSPAIISVTVEPEPLAPLAIGEIVRMRPPTTSKHDEKWTILGIDDGHVWIKRISDGHRMLTWTSDLERVND
jgi:hypothetical protein